MTDPKTVGDAAIMVFLAPIGFMIVTGIICAIIVFLHGLKNK